MSKSLIPLILLTAASALAAPPDLPEPVANNAVAALTIDGQTWLLSVAGLGPAKSHDDVHAKGFILTPQGRWERLAELPGGAGRLGAAAVSAAQRFFLIGGYTVAADGNEVSLPDVLVLDPTSRRFERRAPMPIPVDDAVAIVVEQRWIYLVSGWHDRGNVNLVQVYDTATDSWQQATPWPGNALFGHAGAAIDRELVVCDGVAINVAVQPRRFVASPDCYFGRIESDDPRTIHWQQLPPHPGKSCYRSAAFATQGMIVFSGGADNPYNYSGVGYDGRSAKPCQKPFAWDLASRRWVQGDVDRNAAMDHRGAVRWGEHFWTLGGMDASGQVIGNARRLTVPGQ